MECLYWLAILIAIIWGLNWLLSLNNKSLPVQYSEIINRLNMHISRFELLQRKAHEDSKADKDSVWFQDYSDHLESINNFKEIFEKADVKYRHSKNDLLQIYQFGYSYTTYIYYYFAESFYNVRLQGMLEGKVDYFDIAENTLIDFKSIYGWLAGYPPEDDEVYEY